MWNFFKYGASVVQLVLWCVNQIQYLQEYHDERYYLKKNLKALPNVSQTYCKLSQTQNENVSVLAFF